jgi:hypothetical protein
MKMDFDRFKEAARADPEPGVTEDSGEAEPETEPMDTGVSRPTLDWEIGPDGPKMGFSGPVEIDDPAEFFVKMMEVREEKSGPDWKEQALDLAKDPEVRRAARTIWLGPENVENPSPARAESKPMPDPTAELDPADEPTAETDGGEEVRDGNVYEITPEALVAILQQQIAELSALRPDMTISDLEEFMDKNESRLVGEAAELLEAMDGD